MQYPIYRKLVDGRSFYRIASADLWTEVQVVGTRVAVHHIVVSTYPEMVRLEDMVRLVGGHYAVSDAAEFEAVMARAMKG